MMNKKTLVKWLANLKVGDVVMTCDHWGGDLAFIKKVCKAYVRIGNKRYSKKTGKRMGYPEQRRLNHHLDKPSNESILEFKTVTLSRELSHRLRGWNDYSLNFLQKIDAIMVKELDRIKKKGS